MMGLTVVGKPAATVMTSSPGFSARSPNSWAVRQVSASRVAEEPELTSMAWAKPHQAANCSSNCSANRPVVSQKSREASVEWTIFVGVEDAAGVGDRRTAGDKGFFRKGLVVVLAHEV